MTTHLSDGQRGVPDVELADEVGRVPYRGVQDVLENGGSQAPDTC